MIFDLEAWTRSSARFGYFVEVARRSQTPAFGISLGIGPFASVRQHRDACRVLDRLLAIGSRSVTTDRLTCILSTVTDR